MSFLVIVCYSLHNVVKLKSTSTFITLFLIIEFHLFYILRSDFMIDSMFFMIRLQLQRFKDSVRKVLLFQLSKNLYVNIFVYRNLFEVLACFLQTVKMHSSVIYLTFNGSVFRREMWSQLKAKKVITMSNHMLHVFIFSSSNHSVYHVKD